MTLEKNEHNHIILNNQALGKIDGLIWHKNDDISDDLIDDSVKKFIQKSFTTQIDQIISEGDVALSIKDDYTICYKDKVLATLNKKEDFFELDFEFKIDPLIEGIPLARIALHIQSFCNRKVNLLKDILDIVQKIEDLSEPAQELVKILVQKMGYIERYHIQKIVKDISVEERGKLKKAGVRFGQYGIFIRDSLKPGVQHIKLVLWALNQGQEKIPPLKTSGAITIPYDPELPDEYYHIIGFKKCGDYAVRADMVEKLVDQIRKLATKTDENPKGEFTIPPNLSSYIGKSGEIFDSIVSSLGYAYRIEKVKKIVVQKDNKKDADTDIPQQDPSAPNASEDNITESESIKEKTVENDNIIQDNNIDTSAKDDTSSKENSIHNSVKEDKIAEDSTINNTAEEDNPAEEGNSEESNPTEENVINAPSIEPNSNEEKSEPNAIMTETEVEKKIWFWSPPSRPQKKVPASHSKSPSKKKTHDSKKPKKSFNKNKHNAPEKQHKGTSFVPKKHKIKDENNPFAALSKLKLD